MKGICPICNIAKLTIERRQMNTQYVDEESNYIKSCIVCWAEGEEMWAEQWADYYAGCM